MNKIKQIKIPMALEPVQGKLAKITKIGSVDNPYIESTFGESKEYHIGLFVGEPELDESFHLIGVSYTNQGIITTPVTKIIDDNTFETLNSVYKWEMLGNELQNK